MKRVAPGAKDFYDTQFCGQAYGDAPDADVKQIITDFIRQFDLEDKAILEVGCGRGWYQNLVENWTGVDVALSAGAEIRKPFVCASAEQLPFPEDCFDCIWSIHVLEHIPVLENALMEMSRVLRPGGLLLLKPAWFCRPWAASGVQVRRWRSLTWWERLQKLTIPLRNAVWFRTGPVLFCRLQRELAQLVSRHPSGLHFRPLVPNYDVFWQADSDACNSIDPHDIILWFTSRGWQSLGWQGLRRVWVRGGALVFRKERGG